MKSGTVVRPRAFQSPTRKARLLLARLPVFAGLLSQDGRVLECNFADLGGTITEPTDWIGRPFETGPWWNYSEQSQADIVGLLERAQRGEAVSHERLYLKPDGEMGVMVLSLKPLFAPYGKPDAILVTAVDVTERRREIDSSKQIAHDMSHRLRNSFTVMRTLATHASEADDTPSQTQTLSQRLSRVRHSHALSYRYLFFDVPIQDIVKAAIDDETQLSQSKFDPLYIPSKHVETLMLALGELAIPGHKAELVAQRLATGAMRLQWHEASPRKSNQMPKGLSLMLLSAGLEQKTSGTVTLTNDARGFRWACDFPVIKSLKPDDASGPISDQS